MGKMSKEWHNAYNRKRHSRVRDEYIQLLGGKCVTCSGKEDLQFDHINPSSKAYDVGKRLLDAREKVLAELAKCQLLCHRCHIAKTLEDKGQENARQMHGTLSSHRYCKCDECRKAKNAYMRNYKRKRRADKKAQALVAQLASALDS